MTEFIQHVEVATQHNRDPLDWGADPGSASYLVPPANRARILDREAANGIHPSEDGWLNCTPRLCGTWTDEHGTHTVTLWTRIRWEPMPHNECHYLDQDLRCVERYKGPRTEPLGDSARVAGTLEPTRSGSTGPTRSPASPRWNSMTGWHSWR